MPSYPISRNTLARRSSSMTLSHALYRHTLSLYDNKLGKPSTYMLKIVKLSIVFSLLTSLFFLAPGRISIFQCKRGICPRIERHRAHDCYRRNRQRSGSTHPGNASVRVTSICCISPLIFMCIRRLDFIFLFATNEETHGLGPVSGPTRLARSALDTHVEHMLFAH